MSLEIQVYLYMILRADKTSSDIHVTQSNKI